MLLYPSSLVLFSYYWAVSKILMQKYNNEPTNLPTAIASTTIPSPWRKPILLANMGMESSISAIASARQPTNIPENTPMITSASTVRL